MSNILIARPHPFSKDQARSRVEAMATKMAASLDLKTQWSADVLTFKRSGVNGTINVGEHDVTVRAELGFLLGALKGTIEKEIHRQMDEQLTA